MLLPSTIKCFFSNAQICWPLIIIVSYIQTNLVMGALICHINIIFVHNYIMFRKQR